MKTIKMTKDFRNEENTISIGGHYFEASMEDNSYLNIQINLREKDLITEEIIKQIGLELKDFVSTICKFGWGEMFKETLSEDETIPSTETPKENEVLPPEEDKEPVEDEVITKPEDGEGEDDVEEPVIDVPLEDEEPDQSENTSDEEMEM